MSPKTSISVNINNCQKNMVSWPVTQRQLSLGGFWLFKKREVKNKLLVTYLKKIEDQNHARNKYSHKKDTWALFLVLSVTGLTMLAELPLFHYSSLSKTEHLYYDPEVFCFKIEKRLSLKDQFRVILNWLKK